MSLLEAKDADAHTVMSHLRSDESLRREVFLWARSVDRVPVALDQLVIERAAPDLVRRYRQVQDTSPENLTAEHLASGMWLLPQIENPYGDPSEQGERQLDALAQQIHGARDPGEVAWILGNDFGFGGDRVDYHHPHNSFLNHVIEHRAGLPISAAALWFLICHRLGFTVRLLAIPGHVFGAFEMQSEGTETTETVDYFLDLFANGQAVPRTLLDNLCQIAGHQDAAAFIPGATTRQVLQRMAMNLVVSYQQRGDDARVQVAAAMAGAL